MKITSVKIENFRSILEETILLNDYTCFVGPNGGGKSTVMTALNIFFRYNNDSATDLTNLDEEDFHHKDTSLPIKITATFEELDSIEQEEFKHYYRQGKLVITAQAIWNEGTRSAQVKQFGEREVMDDFMPYFKAEEGDVKAKELEEMYKELKDKYDTLPTAKTKTDRISALREFEENNKNLCSLHSSEDNFYGIAGTGRLSRFIQWVFIPAVKDASDEQIESKQTALGKLIERTIGSKRTFAEPIEEMELKAQDEYKKILVQQQVLLDSLSKSLNQKIQNWTASDSNLNVKWQDDVKSLINFKQPLAEIIAGEGKFQGKIMRFGHGFQRCFIFALLQELSENKEADIKGPKLILACEEPELFQHPPQSKYLSSVFQKLAKQGEQVIVCTHSPFFITGDMFESVRLVRKDTVSDKTIIKSVQLSELGNKISTATGEEFKTLSDVEAKIHQELTPAMNEIFFSDVLILVEGLEDAAYIQSYLILDDKIEEFQRLGCNIIPCGYKSNIIKPLAISKTLNIPVFVVYDSDVPKCTDISIKSKHEKDNKAIQILCDCSTIDTLPSKTIWNDNLVSWVSEIGDAVREEIFIDTAGNYCKDECDNFCNKVKADHDLCASNMSKNSIFIGYLLLDTWREGKKSESLKKLIDSILNFARTHKI